MTTALRFRNIDASPDDPVETWPFEGILAAVERGTLPDWRRLASAIQADPWGPVAHQVLEAVHLSHPYGTTELLEGGSSPRPQAGRRLRTGGCRIRGAGPRRQIRAVQAGFRGENRNLAVSPVDLHVWQGRALSNLDGTNAGVALHASEMTIQAASLA
jgi:hypothetical protein